MNAQPEKQQISDSALDAIEKPPRHSREKQPINWLQVCAIVVPVLIAMLGSYLHADRRITVLEERQENHGQKDGHPPMMVRMRTVERSSDRSEERWKSVEAKIDKLSRDIERRWR